MLKMADRMDEEIVEDNSKKEYLLKELRSADSEPMVDGDTWYLVPNTWHENYQAYLCDQGEHPGSIDLSLLLDEDDNDSLKPNLVDGLDYCLVPEHYWRKLEERHGVKNGLKPIARKVISCGLVQKHKKVEVYLPDIYLMKDFDESTKQKVKVSSLTKLGDIRVLLKEAYGIRPQDPTKLFIQKCGSTDFSSARESGDTEESEIYPGTIYVIETQHEGKWPSEEDGSYLQKREDKTGTEGRSRRSARDVRIAKIPEDKYRISSPSSSYASHPGLRNSVIGGNSTKGVCGLTNLGNTCFMNSVLQCMSNTPPIVKYFLDDSFENDVNEDNPLGMRGQIARSFATLIKQMWSGCYTATPSNFKSAVSKFAPQFHGFQQHDAQELLTFLLDGLHEDLNRIRDKPYITIRDSDGRQDEEVAKEAWDNYLKRNDSVIVDLFHGQLKSTVVCPECDIKSVTFDPFCYLSLPLPTKLEKEFQVIVHPYSSVKLWKHQVSLSPHARVGDLLQAISEHRKSKWPEVFPDNFIATEVVRNHFQRIFRHSDGLESRMQYHIYEVPYRTSDPAYVFLPVVNAVRDNDRRRNSPTLGEDGAFGTPFFVALSREGCTYGDFFKALASQLRPFVDLGGTIEGNMNGRSSSKNSFDPNDEDDNSDDGCDVGMSDDFEDDVSSSQEKRQGGMDADRPGFTDTDGLEFVWMKNRGSRGDAQMDTDDDNVDDAMDDDGGFSIYVGYNELRPLMASEHEKLNFPEKFGQQTIVLEWSSQMKRRYRGDGMEVEHYRPARVKPVQLTDCLSLFALEEKLDATDTWYCPRCKDHIEASKKFDIWKLPKILVIHLKRFQYNRLRRDKIDTVVEFPIKGLDLKDYVVDPKNKESTVYDLIGVCNHYGCLMGGHYTACGLNEETNEWYTFDDSSVSLMSNPWDSVYQAAYVLFYQRRDSSD